MQRNKWKYYYWHPNTSLKHLSQNPNFHFSRVKLQLNAKWLGMMLNLPATNRKNDACNSHFECNKDENVGVGQETTNGFWHRIQPPAVKNHKKVQKIQKMCLLTKNKQTQASTCLFGVEHDEKQSYVCLMSYCISY